MTSTRQSTIGASDASGPSEAIPLRSFLDTAVRLPSHPFIRYFDRTLTFAEVDRLSTAVAAGLVSHGVVPGDRVALFLQNDPDFAIAQLAAWKIGAACVSINPMLRDQELRHILVDSGATALVTLPDLWVTVGAGIIGETSVRTVLLAEPDSWTSQAPASTGSVSAPTGLLVETLSAVARQHAESEVEMVIAAPEDVALICYTSGTSGRPKGVAATHRNVAHSAEGYRVWMQIDERDVFLGGAPIFHVTGLIAGLALAYRTGMSLVLFHRFDPAICLQQATLHKTTFTIMATTAFQALVHHPEAEKSELTSLAKVYSGGAPVTGAIDAQWRALTGRGICNVYGLTETTGPTHAVPLHAEAPIDAESGAMSVGLPLPGVQARLVVPETGDDAATGQAGELWISGPMVMSGYWGLPEATVEAFKDSYFRTGDVGKQDAEGWFFIIDRLKDMINASGYKVWPREVEEFLLQHPDIREAAVVGIPDAYRGESVKAFVVVREGSPLTPDKVVAFAKTQMAAYKYPRMVEIVDSLPKTTSGKVLRRELRARPAAD